MTMIASPCEVVRCGTSHYALSLSTIYLPYYFPHSFHIKLKQTAMSSATSINAAAITATAINTAVANSARPALPVEPSFQMYVGILRDTYFVDRDQVCGICLSDGEADVDEASIPQVAGQRILSAATVARIECGHVFNWRCIHVWHCHQMSGGVPRREGLPRPFHNATCPTRRFVLMGPSRFPSSLETLRRRDQRNMLLSAAVRSRGLPPAESEALFRQLHNEACAQRRQSRESFMMAYALQRAAARGAVNAPQMPPSSD